MTRILLIGGYEGIDVDQTFDEINERIQGSKNGFIFLTENGAKRLYNTRNFSRVVDQVTVESQPQTTETPEESDLSVSPAESFSTPNMVV